VALCVLKGSGNVLLGEYRHTMDSKNRIFLPAKIRDRLGDEIVLSKGIDKCVTVYDKKGWEEFVQKIEELPPIKARNVRRWMFASSNEITVDMQGRIAIPQNLKEYADLGKNIVTIGSGNCIEIWNEENYDAMSAQLDSSDIESTLMEMGL
jgi:MraZ protein